MKRTLTRRAQCRLTLGPLFSQSLCVVFVAIIRRIGNLRNEIRRARTTTERRRNKGREIGNGARNPVL